MSICPRCEHEQSRHTIVDFGCSAIIGDDDGGPIICDCERLFGTDERLRGAGSLISQALARREMPSWRYAHYYGSDERTTNDLLREALGILGTE